MITKRPEVNAHEAMKELIERMEATKKLEDEIQSSKEYILWLKDFLEKIPVFIDYDIV